jgi:hypothetical protein
MLSFGISQTMFMNENKPFIWKQQPGFVFFEPMFSREKVRQFNGKKRKLFYFFFRKTHGELMIRKVGLVI